MPSASRSLDVKMAEANEIGKSPKFSGSNVQIDLSNELEGRNGATAIIGGRGAFIAFRERSCNTRLKLSRSPSPQRRASMITTLGFAGNMAAAAAKATDGSAGFCIEQGTE